MNVFSRLTNLPDDNPELLHDYAKRYDRTFLLYKSEGLKTPYEVVESAAMDGNIIHIRHANSDISFIDGRKEADLQIFLPPVGYYNINGSPYFLIKNPQRQWKRSFCSTFYAILPPIINNAFGGPRLSLPHAIAIYKAEYAPLNAVKHPLFANIALNRDFALTLIDGEPTLLYRRYTVGHLDFDKQIITLAQPTLRQEVQDFLYYGASEWKLQ